MGYSMAIRLATFLAHCREPYISYKRSALYPAPDFKKEARNAPAARKVTLAMETAEESR